MYEIVLGKSESDLKEFKLKGTVYIGKQYVKMGDEYSLSNKIYMDVSRAHAILVCGKRGGGKSYTLGSIAEGLADIEEEVSKNLSFILMDTMGIYWTMKYPNFKEKDLLKNWGINVKNINVVVYVPGGFYEQYLEDNIPVDYPFYLKPNELSIEEWLQVFDLTYTDKIGVAIQKIIGYMEDNYKNYGIDEILEEIQKLDDFEGHIKVALSMRFENCKSWKIFSKDAKEIRTILHKGCVVVMDLSAYSHLPGGFRIKSLVLGIISKRVFVDRMLVRKREEMKDINSNTQLGDTKEVKDDLPMPWLIIDEAHEFLPREGEVPSSNALITILREGRQPGVSLILATQQPGKIHTDAITQSDIVLSHRITASFDLEALDKVFLSYASKGSKFLFNTMPRRKGCAIIMDDKNERLYTMQVKPRMTWHGGSDPNAIETIKNEFTLD